MRILFYGGKNHEINHKKTPLRSACLPAAGGRRPRRQPRRRKARILLCLRRRRHGPGLLLGSMWRDYAEIEKRGKGRILVTTLRMLDERLTKDWLVT